MAKEKSNQGAPSKPPLPPRPVGPIKEGNSKLPSYENPPPPPPPKKKE